MATNHLLVESLDETYAPGEETPAQCTSDGQVVEEPRQRNRIDWTADELRLHCFPHVSAINALFEANDVCFQAKQERQDRMHSQRMTQPTAQDPALNEAVDCFA